MQRIDACRLPFLAKNPDLLEEMIEADLVIGGRRARTGAATIDGIRERAQHRVIRPLQRAVVMQAAVLQFDAAVGLARDVGIVRNHQNRVTRAMQLAEQFHHNGFIFLVEISGWLVGQDQFWLIDERAGDRHALLFAAGKLRGKVRQSIAEAYAAQRFGGL
jgi:hypothetical protein